MLGWKGVLVRNNEQLMPSTRIIMLDILGPYKHDLHFGKNSEGKVFSITSPNGIANIAYLAKCVKPLVIFDKDLNPTKEMEAVSYNFSAEHGYFDPCRYTIGKLILISDYSDSFENRNGIYFWDHAYGARVWCNSIMNASAVLIKKNIADFVAQKKRPRCCGGNTTFGRSTKGTTVMEGVPEPTS